jgi:hypothetical protein
MFMVMVMEVLHNPAIHQQPAEAVVMCEMEDPLIQIKGLEVEVEVLEGLE